MIQKEDLRVKRTQKLILDAFLELTIRKGFVAITVRDIAEKAGINRATFYRHYKDKFDLLNSYTQNVFELLITSTKVNLDTTNKTDLYQMPVGIEKIFEHIKRHSEFYRVMLGKNGDPSFAEKIRQNIQKRVRASIPKNLKIDKKLLDLFVTYSASASFGSVLWWLENEMPYSSSEMVKIIIQLESEKLIILLNKTMQEK